MIGIYAIQNKINGKVYVGQAINIKNRIAGHFLWGISGDWEYR